MLEFFQPKIQLRGWIQQVAGDLLRTFSGSCQTIDSGKVLSNEEQRELANSFEYFQLFSIFYFLFKKKLAGKLYIEFPDLDTTCIEVLLRILKDKGAPEREVAEFKQTFSHLLKQILITIEGSNGKTLPLHDLDSLICRKFSEQAIDKKEKKKAALFYDLAKSYLQASNLYLEENYKKYAIVTE